MSRRDGEWRRQRLHDALLYLCVGTRAETGDLEEFLDAVLANGVDIVQLRAKTAGADEVRAAAVVFRAAADRHDALFILNDDPALAVEVEADGVHVGQEDPTPREAHEVVGRDRLVGRSTHSTRQVDRALEEDCDYFAVGPVHPTPTKEGRPAIGLDPVRHAAAVAGERPWFVTGGMAADTAPGVLAVGARRIVVVRALTQAADPGIAAAQLAMTLRSAGKAA